MFHCSFYDKIFTFILLSPLFIILNTFSFILAGEVAEAEGRLMKMRDGWDQMPDVNDSKNKLKMKLNLNILKRERRGITMGI